MWQAMSPEEARAKILNKAMVGLGTAEDQLIRVISQLNFGERREVKEAYQRMFGKDLVEHIRSETSDIMTSKDFQKALLCMLEEGRAKQLRVVHSEQHIYALEKAFIQLIKSFNSAAGSLMKAEEKPFDLEADCAAMKEVLSCTKSC